MSTIQFFWDRFPLELAGGEAAHSPLESWGDSWWTQGVRHGLKHILVPFQKVQKDTVGCLSLADSVLYFFLSQMYL